MIIIIDTDDMDRYKIDIIEFVILSAFQMDNTTTLERLVKKTGLSKKSIDSRIHKLKDRNLLVGDWTHIDINREVIHHHLGSGDYELVEEMINGR